VCGGWVQSAYAYASSWSGTHDRTTKKKGGQQKKPSRRREDVIFPNFQAVRKPFTGSSNFEKRKKDVGPGPKEALDSNQRQ